MALTAIVALVSLSLTPGCLTVSDDEGPTLSIEIFWDDEPDSSDFQGEDCYGARVDRMEWALWQGSDDACSSADQAAGECRRANRELDGVDTFRRWARDEDNCQNAIDVINAPPGIYELDLTGIDEDGVPAWQATCAGLTVLRFDVAYECDVPAP
jgi:hypothetical protein